VLLLLLSSIGTTSLYIKWLSNDGITNPLRRTTTSLWEVVPASKSCTIMHQYHFIVKYGKRASEDPAEPRSSPSPAVRPGRDPETASLLSLRPFTSRLDRHAKVPYTKL
jgi:hypothetical protein